MGYIIKNITNLLDNKNKYYNSEIDIFKKIKLKPNEIYFNGDNKIDENLNRLSKLKYVEIIKTSDLKILDNIKLDGKKNLKHNLSIIIPTYNNVDYINDAIFSILCNTNNKINVQIIIGIDKCEKTKEYISYNEFYNNFDLYYFNNNVGPYVIKNTLIQYSKYDKILFFDSDDYFIDNSLINICDSLNKYEYINFKYQNIRNNKLETYVHNYAEGIIGINKNIFLKNNGYYPWRCAADTEFRERMTFKKYKIFKLNKVCFIRRLHTSNLTTLKDTGMGSKLRNEYKTLMYNFKLNNYPNPDKLFIEDDHYKL